MSLDLRSQTGALVVGVRRGEKLLENPDPSAPFEAGDIVYFVGTIESLAKALPLFDAQAS
jgi:K+/H+ antiporter YhaU regulatory subunit KhtT